MNVLERRTTSCCSAVKCFSRLLPCAIVVSRMFVPFRHVGKKGGDVRNFDSPPSCWNLGENKETGDENILHACNHVLQGSTVGRACLFKLWASAETRDVLKRDLHSSKNLSPNSLPPRHIPYTLRTSGFEMLCCLCSSKKGEDVKPNGDDANEGEKLMSNLGA